MILGSEGVVSAKALRQERIVSSRNYMTVTVIGGSESFRRHLEEPLFRQLQVSR